MVASIFKIRRVFFAALTTACRSERLSGGLSPEG